MKNKFLKLLIVALMFLFTGASFSSCAQKKESPGKLCNYKDTTHIISFDVAAKLIWNFQNNFRGLKDPFDSDSYMPGYVFIDKDNAANKLFTEHCGFLTYMCMSGNDYYLSFNPETQLSDTEDAYPIIHSGTYYISSNAVPFMNNSSQQIINTELQNRKDDVSYTLTTKSYKKINTDAGNFLYKMLGSSRGALENPVGFFHHDQIQQLLNQNGGKLKGIRIYFGYDSAEHDKIRLIVFAVDTGGINIWKPPVGQKLIILEKSWPPS